MKNEKGANPNDGAPCDCLTGERKGFDTRFTHHAQPKATGFPGMLGAKALPREYGK
jgi:hypothetical protein